MIEITINLDDMDEESRTAFYEAVHQVSDVSLLTEMIAEMQAVQAHGYPPDARLLPAESLE